MLQQLILNIFRDSFQHRFDASLPSLIQEMKQHLFNREFHHAFGRQELLEAYAVRWSPSRALAYLHILCSPSSLSDHMKSLFLQKDERRLTEDLLPASTSAMSKSESSETVARSGIAPRDVSAEEVSIVCLGAGAGAEIVAFAGYLHSISIEARADLPTGNSRSDITSPTRPLALKILDIADWSSVVQELESKITSSPVLSKYASSALKANNRPLVNPRFFSVSFDEQDVLNMEIERLAVVLKDAVLVTLMFTLNELYNVSMSKATNLLLAITYLMQPGSLLMVADSPGSYSIIDLGKTTVDGSGAPEKKYPMQWLLDHTLIEASSIGSSRNASQGGQWEKIASYDSKWFRLPQSLKYPLDLEDMRYQLHLYRRT